MLYLLESTNYYKVGFTENYETLDKRITSYKTHNPDFKLIKIYNGGIKEEKFIHKLLSEHLHYGEWFHKNSNTENIINTIPEELIILSIEELIGSSEYSYNSDKVISEVYDHHTLNLDGVIIDFL